jgi:molybdenum cofactor cytidylyltransferase
VIFAVVPAAGHSTRMGRPKLILPLGNRTIIEHVVTALRAGGADQVLVVCGPHVQELEPLARTAGADVLVLSAPTPDMRSTVEFGLADLENRFRPEPEDAWFLAPADHPALESGIVRTLRDEFARDAARSILVPTHAGKRGHPALIAWRHVTAIRTLPPDQGINSFFRTQSVTEISVPTPEILADLDTPEDYERLKQQWRTTR